MNIDEMTPEEKSVILAELVPFLEVIRTDSRYDEPYIVSVDARWSGMDIYTEWNEWAWRVLNWAMEQRFAINESYTFDQELWDYIIDADLNGADGVFEMPPAEAQRLWLDKILQLAIGAGLLPLQERADG